MTEKLLLQSQMPRAAVADASPPLRSPHPSPGLPFPRADWRHGLPVLSGRRVTLRELTLADAPALLRLLSTPEANRFMSAPPTTQAGFERFIAWTLRQRESGRHACFAVVPHGMTAAIGLFQVRSLPAGLAVAEWGFAIGAPFWGTGVFSAAASLVLDFAFDMLGVHRLEARAAAENGRGNGALRKLGAVQEALLRRSLVREDRYHDQVLWAILAGEWRLRRMNRYPRMH